MGLASRHRRLYKLSAHSAFARGMGELRERTPPSGSLEWKTALLSFGGAIAALASEGCAEMYPTLLRGACEAELGISFILQKDSRRGAKQVAGDPAQDSRLYRNYQFGNSK